MAADMNALNDAPESPDDLGIEDADAFEREQREKFGAALDEAQGYDDETADALEALRDPDIDNTATVALSDEVDVPVRTFVNGRVERQLENLARHDDEAADLGAAREAAIEAMAWFIADDSFGQAHVWRAYAEEYGTAALLKKFNVVVEPYLEAADASEATASFRGDG